ncbi:tetratricopeptide repeat protein [Flavobacterium soli]|uniref:tetratricopeptide repeat protein n=1 Tax=Flavobacterium soli TaxID=344881 RepID=UPI000685A6B5|nr:tetratricopeptide repeat protein [Flavobacterium soli]
MKHFLLTLLFVLIGNFAIGQNNREKALELGQKAIKIMDHGKLDESIGLLEQAQKLDPERMDYPYEIAYANYKKENYPKAIEILNTITEHKAVTDFVYQLLGNAYDFSGKPELALETYQKGMLKFPNSGKFHLESGSIKYHNKEYNEAIAFWEDGIKANPNYSSNYYRLSKVFSLSEERIWTLLYGEYFMLLEPNTERTKEISKLLYENYQKSYEVLTDSTGQFHLTEKGFQIVVQDKKDLKKINKGILPFEGTFASTFALSALHFQNNINIASIYEARKNFLDFWFDKKKFNKDYPNKLLEYQKEIQKNGFFKTYTYWIVSQGNPTEYQEWRSENEKKFDDFADWFSENRIKISQKDFNSRKDYK